MRGKDFTDPKDQRRKARALRKALLAKLIKRVEEGKFEEAAVEGQSNIPRGEYESPRDRDTYNYGYTEIDEMTGLHSPNVWE
jgi:hypothetical protein